MWMWRSEWEEREAAGTLTVEDVQDRLIGIAMHHWGQHRETWSIGFDEDGFVIALVAWGMRMQNGLTLRLWSNDHQPPHVHIQRAGLEDVKIDISSGQVIGDLPSDVRGKELKTMQALAAQHQALLTSQWQRIHES